MGTEKETSTKPGFGERISRLFAYLSSGIWSDPRRTWWLNVLRTVNLSVNSFLNRDIQTQACAMTYRTMLALVPALALLIGIGRGFGIQNTLEQQLFHLFPAQRKAIEYAMGFVDSYMAQTSEGVFLGVGLVFLLWTLISLLGNVEATFNLIWGQRTGRSLWRKISDYTAMMLILPVLMLCAGGLTLMLSTTLQQIFDFSFMTPVISALIEGAQWLMTCLFFAAAFLLIPNTRVKIVNALIAGAISGTGFVVLQWLFLTGTLYVTKYNAIYGSLAFLPLLLLWMQLAWMVTFAGAVICYSSQNVFAFSLEREVDSISERFSSAVTLAVASALARRFVDRRGPATEHDLMSEYELPARLVTGITDKLCRAGVISRVLVSDNKDTVGYQLAIDPAQLTAGRLRAMVSSVGTSDFINNFGRNFPGVLPLMARIDAAANAVADDAPIYTLTEQIQTSDT